MKDGGSSRCFAARPTSYDGRSTPRTKGTNDDGEPTMTPTEKPTASENPADSQNPADPVVPAEPSTPAFAQPIVARPNRAFFIRRMVVAAVVIFGGLYLLYD